MDGLISWNRNSDDGIGAYCHGVVNIDNLFEKQWETEIDSNKPKSDEYTCEWTYKDDLDKYESDLYSERTKVVQNVSIIVSVKINYPMSSEKNFTRYFLGTRRNER